MTKTLVFAAALLVASTYGFAQDAATTPTVRKPCDDLKAEIAKKLDAKGVVGYSLDIVDKGKETEGKIVGSCDGGTKSIVYNRAAAPSEKPADAKKPQ
jgi:Protein of unknown function (DUF1161)